MELAPEPPWPPPEPEPAEPLPPVLPPPLPPLPLAPPALASALGSGASSAWTAWLRPLPVGLTLIVTVPCRPEYFSPTWLMALTVTCPKAMTKVMAATAAATPTRDSRTLSLPLRS